MRSLMGDQESRALFAAESRTRATPSNFWLSLRPLQRKVEFSTDLDPEAGQRTSVSAVMGEVESVEFFCYEDVGSLFAQG